jgi:hypothetical protein
VALWFISCILKNEIIASGLNMQAFIALADADSNGVLIEVSDLAFAISPKVAVQYRVVT